MILGVDIENYHDYFDNRVGVGSTQIKDEKIIFNHKDYNYYKYNSRGPGKIAEAILEYYPYDKEVAPYEKIVFSLEDVKIKEASYCILIDHHEGVSEDDIECLMKRMLELYENEVYEHEIIQILPFDFMVGDSCGLKDPLGKKGATLAARANIIYARKEKLDFMRKIIKKLGIKVKSYNFVYSEYAKMITELKIDEADIYEEKINYENLEYEKIDSASYYIRHYGHYILCLGLCLYGRGYNALYEVDSNGDVLLKGF